MKKVAAVLLVVGLTSSYAFGGVVRFEQTSPDPFNDAALGDTTATFNVYVESSQVFPSGFTAVDVVIGANNGLQFTGFVLDPGTAWIFSGVDVPANPPVFASDLKAGGFASSPVAIPMLLGTMTIDALSLPASPPGNPYEFGVGGGPNRSKLQNSAQPGVIDELTGMGTVNVVPEPAALVLLGLGAIGLLRRRTA